MARIAVLAQDGAQLSAIGTLLDVFDLANRYTERQYGERESLPAIAQTRLVSLRGRPIRLQDGRSLAADDSVAGSEVYDLVYVAPFEIGVDLDLGARLAEAGPAVEWLSRQRAAGAVVAASGAGVTLLAEAGLLGDGVHTIPWWLERPFHLRYPNIEIDVSRMVSQVGDIYCAGSLKAEPALAHRLVERLLSPNVANWIAKITLVDPYPDGPEPWTVFSPQVLRQDGLVGRAQHWLQARFTQKPRLADLAEVLSVSERTLARRFEQSLGMSPIEYLQTLRIEAAKQMLLRSNRRVDRIGYLVGYSDPGFFMKVFRGKTGMSPTEFRRRNAAPHAGEPPAGEAPQAR
jgi:transcriptional regulator GlxA family with amidase domain